MRPASLSGLFVLLAGAVVLYSVVARPTDPVVGEPVASTTLTIPTQVSAAPIESVAPIGGVSPAVAEVLGSTGVTGALTPEETTQIAPEVVRVLAQYGAILVVPHPSGSQE